MKLAKNIMMTLAMVTTTTATAGPLISIGSMYEVLNSDQRQLSKRIYNNGDSSAFVRIEVMEIDPSKKGTESPVETLKDNALVKDRLLVTPMRLIIPPASFQATRILWSGSREKERYYRVRFTPVLPNKDDGFGLDDKAIADYRTKTIQAGVNVLAGYGTVVVVHPDKPKFDTRINPRNNSIDVVNSGNSTVVIENIRNCKTKMTQCDTSSRAFVLPGRAHSIEKSAGQTVSFSLLEGKAQRTLEF